MAAGFPSVLCMAAADGPTLTAAASATCLPVTAKFTFPPNAFVQPSGLWIVASGRISNAVTTPGTARLDVRLGTTVIYDTGALALNTVVKANLPWFFQCQITCRAIGATGNFMGLGSFEGESVVGSPLPSTGGSGGFIAPTGVTAVGGNVDLTVANAFDMNFTQTVATGSFTMHQLWLFGVGLALT